MLEILELPINYSAVCVAGLVAFVLGFLFHGPLFGKLWMKLAGIKEPTAEEMSAARKTMWKPVLANLAVNILMSYILAVVYTLAASSALVTSSGMALGIYCAAVLWLGFVVPVTLIEVIWMGRTCKHWAFEAACSIIYICAMGAIIGSWN